jgi:hypothetical protein
LRVLVKRRCAAKVSRKKPAKDDKIKTALFLLTSQDFSSILQQGAAVGGHICSKIPKTLLTLKGRSDLDMGRISELIHRYEIGERKSCFGQDCRVPRKAFGVAGDHHHLLEF